MNFDGIPVENLLGLSRRERELTVVYDALMDRYAELPDDWGFPLMSIRLLAERYGVDQILWALETRGVPWVARRCRRQMIDRQQLVLHLFVEFPPDDPADVEKAAEELASGLTVFDSPRASIRLLKFLDRLLRQERARQLRARVYH
jgi:hypothetical protein